MMTADYGGRGLAVDNVIKIFIFTSRLISILQFFNLNSTKFQSDSDTT